MKRIFCILLCTIICVSVCPLRLSGQSKNVTVNQPGTLADLIGASESKRISSLIVRGRLNSSDCLFLREMAGRDCNGEPTGGMLRRLSLRNATFASGGTPFFNRHTTSSNPNTVPGYLFYDCALTQIILPATADSIGDFALSGTALHHISLPPHCRLGYNLFQDCALLEDVKMPRFLNEFLPGDLFKGCTNLKQVTFGRVDYVSSNAFNGLGSLQTLIFEGRIGHIDGDAIVECPQLLSIDFRGPVFSTGGPTLIRNCPLLEGVTFRSALLDACFTAPAKCPRLGAVEFSGPVVESEHPDDVPLTDGKAYPRWAGWDSTFVQGNEWIEHSLKQRPFIRQAALFASRALLKAALLTHRTAEALRQLSLQAENDMYYKEELEADTTLAPLQNLPEFKEIMRKAKPSPQKKEQEEKVEIEEALPAPKSEEKDVEIDV